MTVTTLTERGNRMPLSGRQHRAWQAALLALLASSSAADAAASTAPGAPTSQSSERRVLVMDMQFGGTVNADAARTMTDLVTSYLSRINAFSVVAGSEITQVAVLEGKKQQYGCTDSSCLAALADALGARYVVFSRASNLGQTIVIQLRLFDAKEARFLERATVETSSLEALPDKLPGALDQLVRPILDPSERAALLTNRNQPAAEPPAEPAPPEKGISPLVWGGVAALGVGALLGAGTAVGAIYLNGVVTDPASSGEAKVQAQTLGPAILIGGGISCGVALLAGGLLTVIGLVE